MIKVVNLKCNVSKKISRIADHFFLECYDSNNTYLFIQNLEYTNNTYCWIHMVTVSLLIFFCLTIFVSLKLLFPFEEMPYNEAFKVKSETSTVGVEVPSIGD